MLNTKPHSSYFMFTNLIHLRKFHHCTRPRFYGQGYSPFYVGIYANPIHSSCGEESFNFQYQTWLSLRDHKAKKWPRADDRISLGTPGQDFHLWPPWWACLKQESRVESRAQIMAIKEQQNRHTITRSWNKCCA